MHSYLEACEGIGIMSPYGICTNNNMSPSFWFKLLVAKVENCLHQLEINITVKSV